MSNETIFEYEDHTKAGIFLDTKEIKLLGNLEETLKNILPSVFEHWKVKYNLVIEWEQFKVGFYTYYDRLMIARFLVGKQMDVKKAEEMILNDWHWRLIEVQIDQFMIDYPKTLWFTYLSNYYPTTCHGFDQYGVEVNWEQLSCIDLESLFEHVPFKELIAFHIYAVESSKRRVKHQMSLSKEYRFRRILFEDLQGLTMKHLSSKTIDLLKITAEIDDTHYPESLRKLYFIRAPSLFAVFYKAITPFLDKRTVSKLKIVSTNKLESILNTQVPNKVCRPKYLVSEGDELCVLCKKLTCLPKGGKVFALDVPATDTKEMSNRKKTMKMFAKKNKTFHLK